MSGWIQDAMQQNTIITVFLGMIHVKFSGFHICYATQEADQELKGKIKTLSVW